MKKHRSSFDIIHQTIGSSQPSYLIMSHDYRKYIALLCTLSRRKTNQFSSSPIKHSIKRKKERKKEKCIMVDRMIEHVYTYFDVCPSWINCKWAMKRTTETQMIIVCRTAALSIECSLAASRLLSLVRLSFRSIYGLSILFMYLDDRLIYDSACYGADRSMIAFQSIHISEYTEQYRENHSTGTNKFQWFQHRCLTDKYIRLVNIDDNYLDCFLFVVFRLE
jgi:hypothetical protein